MDKRYFSEKIVKWYENNKRELPWRQTTDPYKIWLSEIILQQTRVTQGLPYYQAFLNRYPTVRHLAAASQQDVLRTWQGLGYYTRARNLHKCAQVVLSDFKGSFPRASADLVMLPGIGRYTAAAIASFSSKEVVAVVDGNVFRVLSRVFGIQTPIDSKEGKSTFTELAQSLISPHHPDVHNQAIMEFGALQCVPKNPHCENCVLRKSCFAYNNNAVGLFPVKTKVRSTRNRYFTYVVAEKNGKLSLRQRSENDIWSGLYDFHLWETKKSVKVDRLLKDRGLQPGEDVQVSKTYKHVLTHQTIFSKFIIVRGDAGRILPPTAKYYSLEQVNSLPKPVLISRFLADYYIS